MKKLLLLLTMSLFASTQAFSQDQGYIAFSLGPSIPISDFASKDSNDDSAGLAKTGAIVDISFNYKFGKYFGIAALLRGQSNPTDENVFVQELENELPAGVSSAVDSGNWTIGSLLVGGYGSFPIAAKFSFESRLMVGYGSASSPEINVDLSNGFSSAWVKQESVSSGAFAYLIGAGIKYNAGKRICLLLNLDYFASEAEFKDVEIRGSNGTVERNTFTQPFSTINIGVGVGYRL